MRDECIKAVTEAAGRSLTVQQLHDIEKRINDSMKLLQMRDPDGWRATPPEERLLAASKDAGEAILREKNLKKFRVARTIIANNARVSDRTALEAEGFSRLESLERMMIFDPDAKSNLLPLETKVRAAEIDAIRRLKDVFEATHPRIFGLFANMEGTKAFLYEVFGQDAGLVTKNKNIAKIARMAAQSWLRESENTRKTFNAMGGDVGKLESWHVPQHHSQDRVWGKSGSDADRDAWVSAVLPKLDRTRYVDGNGRVMDDAAMVEFLKHAWMTLATGEKENSKPGAFKGAGMRANAHSASRALHFKDAEGWMEYQQSYGSKDLYSVLVEHVTRMARDIVAVEEYSPNAHAMFESLVADALKHDKQTLRRNPKKADAHARRITGYYDTIVGRTEPPASAWLARKFDTMTNWMVATKLGSAFVTSLPDSSTMHLTAQYWGMSSTRLLRNQIKNMDFTDREQLATARSAGLSLDTFVGEVNRWGQENLGASFSGKMANMTIRSSGLNAITEARRRAFGALMYGTIGRSTRRFASLADLPEDDARLMKAKGITPEIWEVWRKADVEDWGNGNDSMLTPGMINAVDGVTPEAKRRATLALIGMVREEIDMAVIQPGVKERYMMGGGITRGTFKGEIIRSMFLFKSFPISQFYRHMSRGMAGNTNLGKAAYVSLFVGSTTLLGAAALQLYETINGRDPLEMDAPKFWIGAYLKGGASGVYGDFLLQANTSYGNSPTAILAGPMASQVEDIINLTQGNLVQAAQGKETNFGPELVRVLKNNTPLQNLWYTRAVTDRLIFGNLQETINPGYLRRTQRKMEKNFDKSYFWDLNDMTPSRAPDVGRAIGE